LQYAFSKSGSGLDEVLIVREIQIVDNINEQKNGPCVIRDIAMQIGSL
jgi:hypothetical protein